ncbi:hypothetical protein GCM10019071_11590 [Sphingobium fuliginis]|uniref:Uncharacterized protein n=1 Tax=Sphingobium fuliginis (strain ATCC 27551) TaxID=336203 RepID=A0ABQ1ERU0_SPHSA|nr:hypothetical protein GCM10019071_11590 [Sphingobium fuliginis]
MRFRMIRSAGALPATGQTLEQVRRKERQADMAMVHDMDGFAHCLSGMHGEMPNQRRGRDDLTGR